MLKKWIAGIMCAALLLTSAAFAAPGGMELNPGPADEDGAPALLDSTDGSQVRVLFAAGKNVNGKKMVYGKAKNKNIYAYDVTQPGNIQEVSRFATSGESGTVEIYENYVIYAGSNQIEIREIQEDGALGSQIINSVAPGGTVKRLIVLSDALFACTSSGVFVYDLPGIIAGEVKDKDWLVKPDATDSRDFVAEETADGYRIYILKAYDIKEEEISTMRLRIIDLDSSWAAEEKFFDVPGGDVWPGFGQYGKDKTVPGYIEFSNCNNANINLAGEGIVRVTATHGSVAASDDDFVIDATDPTAPVVVLHEQQTSLEYSPTQIDLGDGIYVLIRKYGVKDNPNSMGAVIRDYSNPADPQTLYEFREPFGDYGVGIDNMIFTFGNNGVYHYLKIYDEYTIQDFNLEKGTETAAASFILDNNMSAAQQFMLIAAAYGPDGKMTAIQYVPCRAEGFEKDQAFTAEVAMPAAGGTVKAWVIDNFRDMNILTEVLN